MKDTTISKLETQGYKGTIDVSLDISLFEYGMIHKKTDTGYTIIYGVNMDNGCIYTTFATVDMTEKDFMDDYSANGGWFDLDSLLSYAGLTTDEWRARTLPSRVYDCVSYYGNLNIFGAPHCQFKIQESE